MLRTRQKLTKAFLEEATDTFSMVARENSEFDFNKLPLALKSLGLMMEVDATKENSDIGVDLELFLQVVCACMDDPNWSINEIQESFLVFDREDEGSAELNDFKRVLTKLGEPLTDQEIEDQIMVPKDEQIVRALEGMELNHEKRILVDDFVQACKRVEGKDFDTPEEFDT